MRVTQLSMAAALLALLVPLAAQADDWKDESGKDGGKRERRGVTVQIPHPTPPAYYEPRGYSYGQPVPNGHLPPPGECKIWYPYRPAGQQPPPFRC